MTTTIPPPGSSACLLLAATGCPKKDADPKGKATDPGVRLPSPAADFTLGAVELAKEYEADPKAADLKYKGKWLVVEGKVSDIELGNADEVTVVLKGFNQDPKKAILGHSARLPRQQGRHGQGREPHQGPEGDDQGRVQRRRGRLLHRPVEGRAGRGRPRPRRRRLGRAVGEGLTPTDVAAAKAKYRGKWLTLDGDGRRGEEGREGGGLRRPRRLRRRTASPSPSRPPTAPEGKLLLREAGQGRPGDDQGRVQRLPRRRGGGQLLAADFGELTTEAPRHREKARTNGRPVLSLVTALLSFFSVPLCLCG